MKWLNKLERKFGKLSIPNLMLYITVGMLIIFLVDLGTSIDVQSYLTLDRNLLFKGQVWRLLTFIFIPPQSDLIFMIFALYLFYFIGVSLQNEWGSFKLNFYYFFGMIGTILAALISGTADNIYLNLSLFLAFAVLFPNYEFMLFFILPVKVKYLAYLDAAYFIWMLIIGKPEVKLAIIAALLNFFIFFGPDFYKKIKMKIKYRAVQKNFRKQMRR